jgi:hypothetical protein
MEKKSAAKVVQFNRSSPTVILGETVYLSQEYYTDHNTSIVEVPKFDWLVIGVIENIVQIQYQRNNLKLLTVLMVDQKYLKKQL